MRRSDVRPARLSKSRAARRALAASSAPSWENDFSSLATTLRVLPWSSTATAKALRTAAGIRKSVPRLSRTSTNSSGSSESMQELYRTTMWLSEVLAGERRAGPRSGSPCVDVSQSAASNARYCIRHTKASLEPYRLPGAEALLAQQSLAGRVQNSDNPAGPCPRVDVVPGDEIHCDTVG